MSSAHCSCLPLTELGVNYIPSGNKQKDTKTHKFLHPALLACLSPHANTEKSSLHILASSCHPNKMHTLLWMQACDPGKKPRSHSLAQWGAEMVLNFFLQTLSVTIPYLRFVPLRAAETFCSSECSAPGLTFPGEGADPEAQAPACSHPVVPSTLWVQIWTWNPA